MEEGLILPLSRRSHKTVSRPSMVIGGAIALQSRNISKVL